MFLFLWSHIVNELSIRYIFSARCRHILLADESYFIGGILDLPADFICELPELVGGRSTPLLFLFGIAHELPLIKQLTCLFVQYYHCLVDFIFKLDNVFCQSSQMLPAAPGFDGDGVAGARLASSG